MQEQPTLVSVARPNKVRNYFGVLARLLLGVRSAHRRIRSDVFAPQLLNQPVLMPAMIALQPVQRPSIHPATLLRVVRERQVVGQITADREIRNPGNCQKIENLIA